MDEIKEVIVDGPACDECGQPIGDESDEEQIHSEMGDWHIACAPAEILGIVDDSQSAAAGGERERRSWTDSR